VFEEALKVFGQIENATMSVADLRHCMEHDMNLSVSEADIDEMVGEALGDLRHPSDSRDTLDEEFGFEAFYKRMLLPP
jgi:hypothetical protein